MTPFWRRKRLAGIRTLFLIAFLATVFRITCASKSNPFASRIWEWEAFAAMRTDFQETETGVENVVVLHCCLVERTKIVVFFDMIKDGKLYRVDLIRDKVLVFIRNIGADGGLVIIGLGSGAAIVQHAQPQ